jgi:hypothetical protein
MSKEVKTLVESDGRLYYNMVYATWNGPGWFEGFAKILNEAYKAGSTTSDKLLLVITKERLNQIIAEEIQNEINLKNYHFVISLIYHFDKSNQFDLSLILQNADNKQENIGVLRQTPDL